MERKTSGWNNLVLITQLGLTVVTPVLLCTFVGVFLDRRFGTKTVLAFLVLGVLSGGYSAYKMAKHTIDAGRRREEEAKKAQLEKWRESYGTGDGAARKEAQRRARREEAGLTKEDEKRDGEA